MNIAVILAGGVGKRVGGSTPKQLLEISGKTILEHSVDVFEENAQIDEIAIVVHESIMDDVAALVQRRHWMKVRQLLRGGSERHWSSLAAIEAYRNNENARLLFHDAVRPFVSQRIVNEVVTALERYRAVNVALPASDTIIEVNDSGEVVAVPDRRRLCCVQTPQGFWLETIQAAYARALEDPHFHATDDCGVVFKYLPDTPIFVVRGDAANKKITYKEDLL